MKAHGSTILVLRMAVRVKARFPEFGSCPRSPPISRFPISRSPVPDLPISPISPTYHGRCRLSPKNCDTSASYAIGVAHDDALAALPVSIFRTVLGQSVFAVGAGGPVRA